MADGRAIRGAKWVFGNSAWNFVQILGTGMVTATLSVAAGLNKPSAFVLALGMAFVVAPGVRHLLGALRTPEVAPDGHIKHLRDTAEAMGKAVRSGQAAGGRDRRTAALLAHVPELVVPLTAWDDGVRGVLEAKHALRRLMARVINELDETVYERKAITTAIQDATANYLDTRPDPTTPPVDEEGRPVVWILRMTWDENDPTQPTRLATYPNSPLLIHGSDSEDEQKARIRTLNLAFRSVYSSPEAYAVPHSEDAKDEAMPEVVRVLDSCATRFDLMYVRPDCPDCP